MIMARWQCLLIITLVIFKDTVCTVWDGITPWYTGSKCNCNKYSSRCYFDQKLYDQTGHGGHCLDCSANRDGPNCERCRENYYMRDDGYCIACNCDEIGSRNLQCNAEGKCQCKPGVFGEKCDKCDINHFDFNTHGCKSCGCSELGSANNQRNCDPYSGACYCKENVEGKRCRECKPGFFNLDIENNFGCTPCFCFGHSSKCRSALGFSKYLLESTFAKSSEKWKAEDEYRRHIDLKYDAFNHNIYVRAVNEETIYFLAPDRFLGDQRASYNQLFEFSLRIGDNQPTPTATDIILQGGGVTVTNTIFAQQNGIPTTQKQRYSFRLHEYPDYGWQPRLTSRAFIAMLTNLTAIKIRGTYTPQGFGYLEVVKLESAARGVAGQPALWMEFCDCPIGYVGQFCESCAPGFRHSPALGGPFTSCIPCDCNNHASICDSETGRCICQHNTAGDNCELCAKGYYSNALRGTPQDCLPCDCPNGGACTLVDESIIMCTECPLGYTGHRCDSCSDGFYGDPNGLFGLPTPCQPCVCSMNIDLNAIGNCDTTTGECLKCIHNTGGQNCDVCLPGYFGNALVLPKGDCKQCQCYPPGTEEGLSNGPTCDQITGSCYCKPHVVGPNCDNCENGYYNLHSGQGCQTCNCDVIGSLNHTCNIYTGQCYCRPGVTGLRCDHCEARKYEFSSKGCKRCECDIIGSKDLQCDASGQCPCLNNVEGRNCDRCKENKYNRQKGCIDCPDCYNLVQNAVRSHNKKLNRLNEILDETERQPTVIADEDFPEELQKLEQNVDQFHKKIKNVTGDSSIIQQIQNISQRAKEISRTLSEVDENIFVINDKSFRTEKDIFNADLILEEATEKLNEIIVNFENKGESALEDAWERVKIVDQQSDKMTEIAHEARDMADTLAIRADTIIHKAKEAKNKSIEAYNKAKSANSQQVQITEAIRLIKPDVLNTESKLNKSREWIKEVSDKAVVVKNNALALLNDVKNLVLPLIDIPRLKEKSKGLEEEAYRLKDITTNLFHNSDVLKKIIEEKKYFGKELLQKAHDQQDEINNLRNDLVFCESLADGAINLWNEILEGAESNYKVLTEFDTETQHSKEEAEAALQTIEEIDDIITDIRDKTSNAQNKLEDAKENADLALGKAEQADVLAKNASIQAKNIRNEAELLYKNTTALSEEAELMFDRVQNTEGELKNLLEKTRSNNTLVNDAKQKVGRAGKNTDETSKRVWDLLGDVEGILVELQNSPGINNKDIDRLEEEIKITEQRLKETKLDEKLEDLKKEHKLQDDLIDQYKMQIAFLQKEVENIEQIVIALPDECFKRVELEP